jgi:hypothetical protein
VPGTFLTSTCTGVWILRSLSSNCSINLFS